MNGRYRGLLRSGVLLLSAFGCCLLTAPSSSAGFGQNSQNGQITFETEYFADSSSCARCHDDIVDDEGADISFVRKWDTTMMRFSFFDPFWRAKVQGELLRFPEYSHIIEEKCIRCHAPMASEQIITDGNSFHLFGDGGLTDPENEYYPMAMDGISCTLCHQILEGEGNSGDYSISETRVAFGPFEPDYSVMMDMAGGYYPTYSEHTSSSQLCSVCHDLYTPYVLENGDIATGTFPEQTPYLEWTASSYALEGESFQQCRDCHMDRSRTARISGLPNKTQTRENIYAHTFLTENTMMLEMIASVAEDQGLEFPGLEQAVLDGKDYLAEAGDIEIRNLQWIAYDANNKVDDLQVEVVVTNKTGHKMPTGIPVRRVFIHFAVYDDLGNQYFSSGDVQDDGSIYGVDADSDPAAFEEHHEVIDSRDDVQVYEGIMGRWETGKNNEPVSNVTYTLLRASHFKKDNRLLPKGAFTATVPELIRPYGKVVSDDNFGNGQDTVIFVVPDLGNIESASFRIEAELKDQTLSYRMVHDLEDLVEEDQTGVIQTFFEEYEHHKVQYELIDRDEVHVTND